MIMKPKVKLVKQYKKASLKSYKVRESTVCGACVSFPLSRRFTFSVYDGVVGGSVNALRVEQW